MSGGPQNCSDLKKWSPLQKGLRDACVVYTQWQAAYLSRTVGRVLCDKHPRQTGLGVLWSAWLKMARYGLVRVCMVVMSLLPWILFGTEVYGARDGHCKTNHYRIGWLAATKSRTSLVSRQRNDCNVRSATILLFNAPASCYIHSTCYGTSGWILLKINNYLFCCYT